jgi:adenine-specific DNA-methyltransferase
LDASDLQLLRKIEQNTANLKALCDVVVGIKPYQVGKGQPKQTREIVDSRSFDAKHKKDETYQCYIRGSDINRYCTQWDQVHWISYGRWLAEPRKIENFNSKEKIIIRQTGDSLVATLDLEQFLCLNNTHTINLKNIQYNLRYILALINSRLMNFYYQSLNPEKGEALAEVKATNVKQLPIRRIDFDKPTEKKMHDDLAALVDKMLELNKRLAPIRNTPSAEQEELLREIKRTDTEIDQKVYELYGLTGEEKQVIEASLVSKSSSRSG